MTVLAISGSLRKDSYSTLALRAAQKLAPAGMSVSLADISQIPLYNEDLRGAGDPPAVSALKAGLNAAGKFGATGDLSDETTAKLITELLDALQKLKTRLG